MPKKKKRIGVLDCETDPFEPGVFVEPFLWGLLLDDGSYREFEKTEDLVSWCHEQESPITLYAHNGGKFDYHFLRHALNSDSPISVIAGRLARAHIGCIELRDSLNLFGQTRLADFAKEEIDYRKMRRDVRHLHMPEIRSYLKSDCVNLLELVGKFIDKYGMQFTQAGAAMKYWQKHHAPRDSEGKGIIPQWSSEIVGAHYYEKFSPFYFGGRVQCFKSGHARENFKVWDMTSAYPRAMMDSHAYSTSGVTLSRRLPKERHVPQCLIELDAVSKGALPLRADNGDLFFPDDERQARRYFVTGWEYLAGIETGTLIPKKIIRSHFFGEPVSFAGYIDHFFNERANAKLAGDRAEDIFCKIFMNGLYGKFASNPTRYREFLLSDPTSGQYPEWLEAGYVDGGPWGGRHMLARPLPPSKHRYYNIVTAASITGWVRAFLWRSLLKCHEPLYCDTDSIAARAAPELDQGKKLGQWKLEGEFDEYAIAGKKNYAFHVAGAPRPLDVKRNKPLEHPATRAEWEDLRKHWKLASKGADLTPGEMISAASGGEVLSRSAVQNFSIHKNEFSFIDRKVRSTYRDISRYETQAA